MENLIIDPTAKKNEILIATMLQNTLFENVCICVGDQHKKIPDMQIPELNLGIEVVQIELEQDLDSKYIWEKYYQCNGGKDEMEEFVNTKFAKHNYILYSIDNKVVSWTTFCLGRKPDYMRELYYKNLDKKLKKLNKGNYKDNKGDTYLAISHYERSRDLSDINILREEYLKLKNKYVNHFKKIYVLTSDKVYTIDEDIKTVDLPFNSCVLQFKEQNLEIC